MDGKQFLEDEFPKELTTIYAPHLVLDMASQHPARPGAGGGINGQKAERRATWMKDWPGQRASHYEVLLLLPVVLLFHLLFHHPHHGKLPNWLTEAILCASNGLKSIIFDLLPKHTEADHTT
jgi:hypothetical protein